jgi:putative flippase GtrA
MIIDILKISIICSAFYQLGQTGHIFNWYQRLIENLPEWLMKPLGGCGVCFSGQVLFHYYWITHLQNYNIIDQLFYPAAGIFLATILNYIYEKTGF